MKKKLRYEIELLNIGANIRKLRKKRKWIQLDLELKTGVSRSDVSKIENGHKNIEYLTLVKFAEALEVETIELLKKP